jgi:hypothetical protein
MRVAISTSGELRELLPVEQSEPAWAPPPSTSAGASDLNSVERRLSSDEKIEWIGKPDPEKRFTPADRFLVPFSLMWGGFAIVWETLAISGGAALFALFGLPLVAMGLYFIFGRFIYKANRKRRTIYAVTSRRVLAIVRSRNGVGESVAAVYLRSIPNMSTSAVSGGKGSVEFGVSSPMYSQYANSGLEIFARGEQASGVAFFDIEDPQGVADLVERLRAADRT